MNKNRFFNIMVSLMVLTTLLFGNNVNATAMPMGPTDESKVPHYFGPYPNWANSPFTMADAQVVITGDGTGATAVATVGANGAITGLTITNPGHNYSNAKVDILGSGTGATADVTIVKKGAVVAVTLDVINGVVQSGTGYTAPVVTFNGNGGAAATAYGGVENNIQFTGGFGYQFPTVDFDLPDGPNGVQAQGHAQMDANGAIVAVVVDNPGSGYSTAPNVVIRDGTLFDPINPGPGFVAATATATLSIQEIVLSAFGSGYQTAPTVTITDPTGLGAAATAVLDNGIISAITLKKPGSGYLTAGGIKKFTDPLPGLCQPPACPATGKYIPLGVPEVKTYNGVVADEYVIGLVQYRTSFSSSLPNTLVRGYVQLETTANAGISQHFPLTNEMLDGTKVPVLKSDGTQWLAVTPPQYLGPTIAATKDRPVRIVFHNLLPTGSVGDLFLPTDSTLMGSGMGPFADQTPPTDSSSVMDEVRNPMCTEGYMGMMPTECFTQNRATLHLHGGITPWISDGTPHQWITPAGENTSYPEGVSVENVPDMDVCKAADDGCQTFYYTNQQSARLMFYHDHAWGITRLNVYAGEAAGYLITDATEQALINSGTIPGAADTIPLVIQDKTFVPDAAQLALQDPTWDATKWGSKGSFWYHHVYMPAQNPGDPSGMSAYGRWMYGPWFWPPAANTVHGPIPNPYYDPNCNLDNPATWQYQTDPFCEPEQIPGTPNISVGMEQFNDTPIVNGVAYPTLTLEPKTYRLRILSAANDRFFNFQWYVGDPSTASTGTNSLGQVIGATEVALNPAELAAAQLDPNIFPTPVQGTATAGPDWVQIGTEGGFLPAPVVVDGQQPTTWIIDPTRFDVGNVDKHSLLLAPAERADVIVDFSKFAGQTLILYNDAPAAFPARVASYDYYTGAPDLSPVGAPTILPGYGPNTRTIMQVKIAGTVAPAFNLSKLQAAFRHNASGTGVFESGQHPIIVGQAAYNTAYGTSFASGSNCNAPNSTVQRCDGFVRISDTAEFGFNTLKTPTLKMTLPLQPKAIHDEMNSTTFDEFGRMQATLGIEAQPPNPGAQNVTLYPYTASPTELIDGTNLPKGSDIKVIPISSATDGTQIWRITHNGVDTHPIHFHLYDVQVINRVTWDNIIIPTEASELGWKDTVRISPLEDTIVALRPVIPQVPFDVPNSVHTISPMMPEGVELSPGLLADPQGNPVQVFNNLINFGWEYVYHCHILSHEEMDMMRPVLLALPPVAPIGAAFDSGTNTLSWIDNSLSETAFAVEKSTDGINWTEAGRIARLLSDPNTAGNGVSFVDIGHQPGDQYRVVAENTVGDTNVPGFPVVTTKSTYAYIAEPPAAPTNLTATLQDGPKVSLAWTDNSANEISFVIERQVNGGGFSVLSTVAFNTTSYVDGAVLPGNTYDYQVKAVNATGASAYTNQAGVIVPTIPSAPSNLVAALQAGPQISLTFTSTATNETGFVLERSVNGGGYALLTTLVPGSVGATDASVLPGNTYQYRIAAKNQSGMSAYTVSNAVSIPSLPAAPTNLVATLQAGPQIGLTFTDNATNETGFTLERSVNGGAFTLLTTLAQNAGTGTVTATDTTILPGNNYQYRVAAVNLGGTSASVNSNGVTVPAMPAAPTNFTAVNGANQGNQRRVVLNWSHDGLNVTGFRIERSTDNANWTLVTTTGAAARTFTVTGLTRNTNYYFRIRANNGAIIFSTWVSVGPILTNP